MRSLPPIVLACFLALSLNLSAAPKRIAEEPTRSDPVAEAMGQGDQIEALYRMDVLNGSAGSETTPCENGTMSDMQVGGGQLVAGALAGSTNAVSLDTSEKGVVLESRNLGQQITLGAWMKPFSQGSFKSVIQQLSADLVGEFPQASSSIGDIDFDGVEDVVALAAGSPSRKNGYVYSGKNLGLIGSGLREIQRSNFFFCQSAPAGDQGATGTFTQDGVADFAVAMYGLNEGRPGWVTFYSGAHTGGNFGIVSQVTHDTALFPNGDPGFGYGLCNIGDLDGDGRAEIVVASHTEAPQMGRELYLISSTGMKNGGNPVYSAPADIFRYGLNMRFLGDTDGDGLREFALCGTSANVHVYEISGAFAVTLKATYTLGQSVGRNMHVLHDRRGASHLVLGIWGGTGFYIVNLRTGAIQNVPQSVAGLSKLDGNTQFGWYLGNAGDHDGDGLEDIITSYKLSAVDLDKMAVISRSGALLGIQDSQCPLSSPTLDVIGFTDMVRTENGSANSVMAWVAGVNCVELMKWASDVANITDGSGRNIAFLQWHRSGKLVGGTVATTDRVISTETVPSGAWRQVDLRIDTDLERFDLNIGPNIYSIPTPKVLSALGPMARLHIGGGTSIQVDEVGLWSRVLTDEDIAQIQANPIGGSSFDYFAVNTTSDVQDGNVSTVAALTASPGADGRISLREALVAICNETSPLYAVTFDPVVFRSNAQAVIIPLAQLPTITRDGVILDASNAGVTIDGISIPSNRGIDINASNVVVKGLNIRGFTYGKGIRLNQGSCTIGGTGINDGCVLYGNDMQIELFPSTGKTAFIYGNYIGTNRGFGNLDNPGYFVSGISKNGLGNAVIGGLLPGERNYFGFHDRISYSTAIECTAGSTQIIGNYIGATPTGQSMGNSTGIHATNSSFVTIKNNVIGFNTWGIQCKTLVSKDAVIQGNFIGAFNPAGSWLNIANHSGITVDWVSTRVNISGGNVFGFNQRGIALSQGITNIRGNYFGTSPTGNNLAQTVDVLVRGTSSATIGTKVSGEGNIFGFSGASAIDFRPQSGSHFVRGNSFGVLNTGGSNWIGLPSTGNGIWVHPTVNTSLTIGGKVAGEGNTFGNYASSGKSAVLVERGFPWIWGNRIGITPGGQVMPNTTGIDIKSNANLTIIGSQVPATENAGANVIAHNLGYGISIAGASATQNRFRGNSIHSNGSGAIAVTGGANGGITPPTLVSVTGRQIIGSGAVANASIDVYESPPSETQARVWLGSGTANGSGNFTFVVPDATNGYFIDVIQTSTTFSSSALSNGFTTTVLAPQITFVSPANGSTTSDTPLTIAGAFNTSFQFDVLKLTQSSVTVDGVHFSNTQANITQSGFSFDPGPAFQTLGVHTVTVFVRGTDGGTDLETFSFTYAFDTQGPSISASNFTDGAFVAPGLALQWSITDTGTVTSAMVKVDAGSYQNLTNLGGGIYQLAAQAPGAHTYTVRGIDNLGNPTLHPGSFTVPVAPTISSLTPPNGGFDTTSPMTVSGVFATGATRAPLNTARCTLTLDGTLQTGVGFSNSGFSFQPGPAYQAEGAHTMIVTIHDVYGQLASSTSAFTRDITGPSISPFNFSDGGTLIQGDDMVWTITDALSSVASATVRFDAGAPQPLVDQGGNHYMHNGAGLGLGVHTYVVSATDAVGRIGQHSGSFTVAPVGMVPLSIFQPTPVTSAGLLDLTIMTAPNATVNVIIAGVTHSMQANGSGIATFVDLPIALGVRSVNVEAYININVKTLATHQVIYAGSARVFELDAYYRVKGHVDHLPTAKLNQALTNFASIAPTEGTNHEVFVYDPANNISSVSIDGTLHTGSSTNMNELESLGSIRDNMAYDIRGRVTSFTSDGILRRLTWNLKDELVMFERGLDVPGLKKVAEYGYYPDGMRAWKKVFGPDGSTVILQENFYGVGMSVHEVYTVSTGVESAQPSREYVHEGLDRPVVMFTNADGNGGTGFQGREALYFHTNPRGDVYALTNEAGQIVERYTYNSTGVVTVMDAAYNVIPASAFGNDLFSAGMFYDRETGLYQVRFRYLDPVTGNFLSRDPAESESLGNLYAGFERNAGTYTDPWGLEELRIGIIDGSDKGDFVILGEFILDPSLIFISNLTDAVQKIKDQVGPNVDKSGKNGNCIKVLRIVGHGSEANVSVGAGRKSSKDPKLEISKNTLDKVVLGGSKNQRELLESLRPLFCDSGAMVVIDACNVASGNDGRDFVDKLADIFGVEVHASINDTNILDSSTEYVGVPGKKGPRMSLEEQKKAFQQKPKPKKKVDKLSKNPIEQGCMPKAGKYSVISGDSKGKNNAND